MKAALISAVNYPKDADTLSFQEKLMVLQKQADLNATVKEICLHISLNFDPSEQLSADRFEEIAKDYMDQIGFGNQPYLIYQHKDAAHPHLHIVTTTIKSDGNQIRLRYIGRDKSEPARKNIEEKYGLVRAGGRGQQELFVLKPADLQKAWYGKSQTKGTISNYVRCVYDNYSFRNLEEYNTILEQFNLTAYRGEPGTTMHEKGGLVYSFLDPVGKRLGVPIKASTIYGKPTLKNLAEKFIQNDRDRTKEKEETRKIVGSILHQCSGMETFIEQLFEKGVYTKLRINESGQTYGINFIDNNNGCVFKGSDLDYSVATILKFFHNRGNSALKDQNRHAAEQALSKTDFTAGLKGVLTQWAANNIAVTTQKDDDGAIRYFMGRMTSPKESRWQAPTKMQYYFKANDLAPVHCDFLEKHFTEYYLDKLEQHFTEKTHDSLREIVSSCFELVQAADYVSKELLEEAKKKKKKRRRL